VATVSKARSSAGALKLCRAAIFVGTGFVLTTGYLGGEMTFGPGHITKPLSRIFASEPTKHPLENGVRLTPSDKIDFETQIAPILQKSCIKCHNPKKIKGKLLLDTKTNAMKGGKKGMDIVPGQPDKSRFYTLLINPNDDERMPDQSDPLPKEQIELIRKWIEQDAIWPDGVTIK